MLNLFHKDPLTIKELARVLDKNMATIYRWGSPRGVRGHRLPLTRIGGRTYVYRSDWENFLNASNKTPEKPPVLSLQNRTYTKQHSSDLVDIKLSAAGF